MENYIVTGLGYGDEGKGTTVDWLSRAVQNPLVVRHNGGPQAAHNVVLPSGAHHTFSQFGSGTFAGAPTHASSFMLINPENYSSEWNHLYEVGCAEPKWTVSPECRIITPYHIIANQCRENQRKENGVAHGSCGQGVGELMRHWLEAPDEILYVKDLFDRDLVEKKFSIIRLRKFEEGLEGGFKKYNVFNVVYSDEFYYAWLDILERFLPCVQVVSDDEIMKGNHSFIFEGAQGVLLDEDFGFHPYTTWSKTTDVNARGILGVNSRPAHDRSGAFRRLGVLRTYSTRHGNGPFPPGNYKVRPLVPKMEHHNGPGQFQGNFRTGPFDLVATKYALRVNPVDSIVLTHTDWLDGLSTIPVCVTYDAQVRTLNLTKFCMTATPEVREVLARDFVDYLEENLGVPISVISKGPTFQDKEILKPELLGL